ncbi:MAG: 30S ribosomal protein S12 methylthiotransferase RimO [Anaerolineae bacterium]|jgi:ribosomal protein S12 methylthiotransferase|nr:30S ribosomal protein S12 methylthiotransferase RimO [Anaerolineae bacterium]MBT3712624.1 30S ribosomal protein S12 methylthiotransferase RimO [Anaerolineae bacterium]MBT4312364.1 30S ribosomal protein S12 methylthiotransferase RimO [Anaerolineae bacterium]MBT4457322.1 30S ribosomal protein S12 methylthiotransferase RimO [Anaerolineae bacterium]MBT4842865.1 30S ribosomal protein S12 methylthiotransferase RimO [Anaerolineae bacterium]
MKENTFHLVSLGCAKNTVDSDSMAQLLLRDGYSASEDPALADILIVNTCGFIGPSRDESIEVLNELAEEKVEGQLLIAAGCLSQRFSEYVAEKVPNIDGMLGTRRWMDIVSVVKKLRKMRNNYRPEVLYHLPENAKTVGKDEGDVLRANVFGSSAYLKIADGCRRPCAFCSIPLIKGTAVSRPLEDIVEEAEILYENGIRELILIAQDSTDYGHDLGMKDGLAILLEEIVKAVPDMDWIRIMYAYPGYVTDRLIDVMAENPQILPYLDIPLQHASPEMLKRMKRPANMDWVHKTLAKMRERIENLTIRTTFIVGYPGETEEEFQALLDFIEEIRFDRVGAFQFSFEPGTTSEPLGDPVSAAIKEERWERLMEIQQNISLQVNQSYVGKTLDILIEGYDEEQGISIGRSYRDAPEIDGMVFIEGDAEVGEIVPARITGAMAYDLTAVLVEETTA